MTAPVKQTAIDRCYTDVKHSTCRCHTSVTAARRSDQLYGHRALTMLCTVPAVWWPQITVAAYATLVPTLAVKCLHASCSTCICMQLRSCMHAAARMYMPCTVCICNSTHHACLLASPYGSSARHCTSMWPISQSCSCSNIMVRLGLWVPAKKPAAQLPPHADQLTAVMRLPCCAAGSGTPPNAAAYQGQ